MTTQTQPQNEVTIGEKIKIGQYLAGLVALTLTVFAHRKVGYRTLKPARLIGIAFFLWFINGLSNDLPLIKPFGFFFSEFPLAFLVAGFLQRHNRWKELCNGDRWHTYSDGVSYLELLPLPAFLKAYRRLYRIVEPVAFFVLAMFIGMFLSRPLAQWIAFSSFCLFIYQQALFELQLDRDLTMLDNIILAEVQSETVDRFTGPQPSEVERTLEETAGIPTGVSLDIRKQIETRRVKQRKSTPDNLEIVATNT